jgi:hypothetical protein
MKHPVQSRLDPHLLLPLSLLFFSYSFFDFCQRRWQHKGTLNNAKLASLTSSSLTLWIRRRRRQEVWQKRRSTRGEKAREFLLDLLTVLFPGRLTNHA